MRLRWRHRRGDDADVHDERLRALAWLSADNVLGRVPGTPDWRGVLEGQLETDGATPAIDEPTTEPP